MGAIGPLQLALLTLVALLLFGGRGKISAILGDLGKGLKVFRRELNTAPDAISETEPSSENQKSSG